MPTKVRLAVLGSTKGTDLQAIMDAIEKRELEAEVVLVASDRKEAFILERANKHNIATMLIEYKNFAERSQAEAHLVEELKKRNTDLILLIGFMKILTPYFVNEFRGRIWNIHPSLLPKYAGGMNLEVHARVLENKESETGCTLHEVTESVDSGRIIMQKKCKVESGDTVESLKQKVQRLEQECFLEAIKKVSKGEIILQ